MSPTKAQGRERSVTFNRSGIITNRGFLGSVLDCMSNTQLSASLQLCNPEPMAPKDPFGASLTIISSIDTVAGKAIHGGESLAVHEPPHWVGKTSNGVPLSVCQSNRKCDLIVHIRN